MACDIVERFEAVITAIGGVVATRDKGSAAPFFATETDRGLRLRRSSCELARPCAARTDRDILTPVVAARAVFDQAIKVESLGRRRLRS